MNEIKPEVGMGATCGAGSDRYPYTIVEVSPNGKTVVVQADNYKLIAGSIMSEEQEYEFTPNPKAHKSSFTLRKNGRYVRKTDSMNDGLILVIGYRDAYRDPTF